MKNRNIKNRNIICCDLRDDMLSIQKMLMRDVCNSDTKEKNSKMPNPSDDSREIYYKPRVFLTLLYLDIVRIFVFKEMLGPLGPFILENEETKVLKG